MSASLLARAQSASPAPTPAPPATTGPLPLSAFYDEPTFTGAQLSPDGQSLAYIQYVDKDYALVIRRLDTGATKIAAHTRATGMSIDWVKWKDGDRLLMGMSLLDIKRVGDKPDGDVISYRYGRFIFAMNRDGTDRIQLLKNDFWHTMRGSMVSLLDRLKTDPDHVLAIAPDASDLPAVWNVNIRTGEAKIVEHGRRDVDSWRTDITGAIVGRFRVDGGTLVIEARAPGESAWTKVVALRPKDLKAIDDFDILGATEKPNQFYVSTKPTDPSEGDTRRVRIYDVITKTLGPPISPERPYDVDDIVADEATGELQAVCYKMDTYVCEFTNPVLEAHYKALSTFFEGERNIAPLQIAGKDNWWLLSVSGPDEPASYYLYNQTAKKVEFLGAQYPDLEPARLGTMQRYSFTARDGVKIAGYLTRPPKAQPGPLPLIVMPHGGPNARDTFEYDDWVQILATRGYMIFQPNFRGSGGFGVKFEEAGYHKWGGVMADDLTDGVQALIKSGQADPNRICIFGASYGGYAALYAGATHSELYKCVVSWAGPSDLMVALQYEKDRFGADSGVYKYWAAAIGDPVKDAAEIKAASPIPYAATYKPPVLLLHGADDDIVPDRQSKLMEAALKRAGKDVTLIEVRNEDHPRWSPANEQPALAAIVKFIGAHIGPSPGPAVAPALTAP